MRRGRRHLRIFTLWTQRMLPIVDKAKYLGAQLSYESFEDATTQHRVVAARAAFGRLRRILTSRSNLSLASRVKLWSACVGTCLYYALDSCGVTLSGLQKVRVLVQKHLRAISRTPAHITHVGNQELLDQLGVKEPGAYILRNMEGQLERWQANQRHIEPILIKAKSDIGEWRCSVQQSLRDMLQKEHVAGRSLLHCPKCGLECANKTVLGSHMATAHAKGERPVFDRLRRSIGGRPRCSGCKELLSSWARLQKHIEHGACPLPIGDRMPGSLDPAFQSVQTQAVAPDPAPPDSAEAGHKTADAVSDSPLRFQQPVLDILKQHGWRGLLADQRWRPKLAQWCCLCGTWCASNRAVKMHLARSHKDVWNPVK